MKALNVSIRRSLITAVLAALAVTALACGSSNNNTTNPDAGGGGQDAAMGCQSTMPNCNSCVTMAQDPLNACTGAVTNCQPFDDTRVPKGPDGKVPQVP
jgi:hypothetical protein